MKSCPCGFEEQGYCGRCGGLAVERQEPDPEIEETIIYPERCDMFANDEAARRNEQIEEKYNAS